MSADRPASLMGNHQFSHKLCCCEIRSPDSFPPKGVDGHGAISSRRPTAKCRYYSENEMISLCVRGVYNVLWAKRNFITAIFK